MSESKPDKLEKLLKKKCNLDNLIQYSALTDYKLTPERVQECANNKKKYSNIAAFVYRY